MGRNSRFIAEEKLFSLKEYFEGATNMTFIAEIIYWFNPLAWYTLKEMRNDREVACDTSILKILEENALSNRTGRTFNQAAE